MTIPQVPMQLVCASDGASAELHIMGDVTRGGFFGKKDADTDAHDMSQALADLPGTVGEITVHINSYGGEVAEGVTIYNALKAHPARVTTVCEGFACSIASVIFMAGDRRVMRDASLLMLHNASMGAWGTAEEHRKAADDLDAITELSKRAYLACATDELTPELLNDVMDAETWVTPEQALAWGLATEVDADGGQDGPTQTARRAVMRRLTGKGHAMKPNFSGAQMDEINADVLTQVMDAIQHAGGVTGPEPEPEPGQDAAEQPAETASERYARIFRQLADALNN